MPQDDLLRDIDEVLNPTPDQNHPFWGNFGRLQSEFRQKYGRDFTITGRDTDPHKRFSKGLARDVRSRDLTREQITFIRERGSALGLKVKDFSYLKGPRRSSTGVLFTGPHIHIEHPKGRPARPSAKAPIGDDSLLSDIQNVLDRPSADSPIGSLVDDIESVLSPASAKTPVAQGDHASADIPSGAVSVTPRSKQSGTQSQSVAELARANNQHPITAGGPIQPQIQTAGPPESLAYRSALTEIQQLTGIDEKSARVYLESREGKKKYPGLIQYDIADYQPGQFAAIESREAAIRPDAGTVTATIGQDDRLIVPGTPSADAPRITETESVKSARLEEGELYLEWFNARRRGDVQAQQIFGRAYLEQFQPPPVGEQTDWTARENIQKRRAAIERHTPRPISEAEAERTGTFASIPVKLILTMRESGLDDAEILRLISDIQAANIGLSPTDVEVLTTTFGQHPLTNVVEPGGSAKATVDSIIRQGQSDLTPEEKQQGLGAADFVLAPDLVRAIRQGLKTARPVEEQAKAAALGAPGPRDSYFETEEERKADPKGWLKYLREVGEKRGPEAAQSLLRQAAYDGHQISDEEASAAGLDRSLFDAGNIGTQLATGAANVAAPAITYLGALSKIKGLETLGAQAADVAQSEGQMTGSGFGSQLLQGGGSMGAFILTPGGSFGSGVMGAFSSMGQAYEEMVDRGIPEDDAKRIALLFAPAGAMESFGVNQETILKQLRREGVERLAAEVAKEYVKGGAKEVIQETTQNVITDWMAKNIYDPKRDIFDIGKLLETGAVSFILGGAGEGGGRAISGIREGKISATTGESADSGSPVPSGTIADDSNYADTGIDADTSRAQLHTSKPEKGANPNDYKKPVLDLRDEPATGKQAEAQAETEEEIGKQPPAPVDSASHEAATSDANDRPQPTEAQIEAGNYKKGHARVAGLDISIENPEGTQRRPEWPPLKSHYGYIRRTEGSDGEHIDVFVKPGTPTDFDGPVFVVDQTKEDGSFDEHKVMLGFANEEEARAGYSENFTPDWKVGPVREFASPKEFKEWLDSGDTSKPASLPSASTKTPSAPSADSRITPAGTPRAAEVKPRPLRRNYRAGNRNAEIEFESAEQRDLYDLAAKLRFQPSGKTNAKKAASREEIETLTSDLVERLKIPKQVVLSTARETHDDVRAQMKGVSDGELRKVKDNVRVSRRRIEAAAKSQEKKLSPMEQAEADFKAESAKLDDLNARRRAGEQNLGHEIIMQAKRTKDAAEKFKAMKSDLDRAAAKVKATRMARDEIRAGRIPRLEKIMDETGVDYETGREIIGEEDRKENKRKRDQVEAARRYAESVERNPQQTRKPKADVKDTDDIRAAVRKLGGIKMIDRMGEQRRLRESRLRQPGIFNKDGLGYDDMARALSAEGFPIDETNAVESMFDLLERAAGGERILSNRYDFSNDLDREFHEFFESDITDEQKQQATTLKDALEDDEFHEAFRQIAQENATDEDIRNFTEIARYVHFLDDATIEEILADAAHQRTGDSSAISESARPAEGETQKGDQPSTAGKQTQDVADLDARLATGEITEEEYQRQIIDSLDVEESRAPYSTRTSKIDYGTNAPPFYSHLERAISDLKQERLSVEQVEGILRKGVKADEMKWTGLDDFLAAKKAKNEAVTKAELIEFARENAIQVRVLLLGEGGTVAQFDDPQLNLPGGENYREMLISLPNESTRFEELERKFKREGLTEEEEAELLRLEAIPRSEMPDVFIKPDHFNYPNVVAHVRFDERTDADGNRVLFVEEVQSDWHQQGRKKGYRDQSLPEGYRVEKRGAVPAAPFSKAWHELALKRVIRYAADRGYDRVGWTTGEQQKARSKSAEMEGIARIYDQIVPFFLNKFGKKFGTQVGLTQIEGGKYTVHSIDITPEMRRAAQTEGYALFESGTPYTRTGNRQKEGQDLDFDYERRADALPDSKRLAGEAVRDLEDAAYSVSSKGGKLLSRRLVSGSGVRTIGLAITAPLKRTGRIDLRGMIARTVEDVAQLAQVFRDPRFESFRIVYTKGDQIVGHEGVSSRLPDSSAAFINDTDYSKAVFEIQMRMKRMGADGYFLLHNHPSGDPSPSKADAKITALFETKVKGFRGHIVINSGKYSVAEPGTTPAKWDKTIRGKPYLKVDAVSALAAVKQHKLTVQPERLLKASIPHDLLNKTVGNEFDIAVIGKQIQSPDGFVTLIYRDSAGKVRAIQEMPIELFKRTKEAANYLRGRRREFGAPDVIAYYKTGDGDVGMAGLDLMQKGELLDFGFQSTSLHTEGVPFGKRRDKKTGHRVAENRAAYSPKQLGKLAKLGASYYRTGTTGYSAWNARMKGALGAKYATYRPQMKAIYNAAKANAQTGKNINLVQPRTPPLEVISAFRKSGLLTGIRTHLKNIGGTGLFQLLENGPTRAIGSLADITIGAITRQRAYTGPSLQAEGRSGVEAATRGIKEAAQIVRQGVPSAQLNTLAGMREVNSGSKLLDLYINLPFRVLAAEDKVFRVYAFRRALEDRALSMAKTEAKQGTLPQSLSRRPMTVRDRARQIVAEAQAGVREDLVTEALSDAEVATFNNSNKFGDAVQAAKEKSGQVGRFAIDLAIPFSTVPSNVVSRALDYAGVGVPRTLIKSAISRSFTAEDQRAFSQAVGRAGTGIPLIMLGWQLASAGLMTGAYDDDDQGDRDRDEVAGRKPGAIRIGNKWHEIVGFSPFGNLLTLGATLHEAHTEEIKEGQSRFAKTAKRAADATIFTHPLAEGTKEAGRAISTGDLSRAGRNIASSFVPAYVATAAEIGDDTARQAGTVGEAVKRRVPGLRNQLPARLDAFGRPVPQPNAFNPFRSSEARETSDPIIAEMIRVDANITREKPSEGKDIPKRGEKVYNALRLLIASIKYKKASDKGEKDAKGKIIKKGKKELIEEMIKKTRASETKKTNKTRSLDSILKDIF